MSSAGEATLPATRRTRKSIGSSTDLRKGLDKENATVDMGSTLAASRKKSRSKSMGPGGLDALKKGTGNRRASLAAPSKPPRSILKQTISALPEIPPLKQKTQNQGESNSNGISKDTSNPSGDDSTGSKIALRTEEEQQAAARAREELERRDARRKSLANRRVSFAAEATLHTFHEVEYIQDSTTFTNSTRRASAASKSAQSFADVGHEGALQTQPENVTDPPESQGDLYQKKRRRSSGAQAVNYTSHDDHTGTSTIYSSDSEPPDAVEEIASGSDEGSSSDSDDGTMMSIETEEVTGTTMGSMRSIATVDESSTIDEALRVASQRAGNRQADDDRDDDDLDDGEEVIPSFGWVKKGDKQNQNLGLGAVRPVENSRRTTFDNTTDMGMDMDITSAVGGIIKPVSPTDVEEEEDEEQEMSMDVTQAFGGILSQNKTQQNMPTSTESDSVPMDDATMELTTAIGGIRIPHDDDLDSLQNDEDMSMEFTTVLGGMLSQIKSKTSEPARQSTLNCQQDGNVDGATTEVTSDVGQISGANLSEDEIEGDATVGMDMTMALGRIIGNESASQRALGKKILEEEVNKPNSPKKAVLAAVSRSSPRRASTRAAAQAMTENASPGLSAFHGKGLRRSSGPQTLGRDEPKAIANLRTPSPAKLSTPKSGSRMTIGPLPASATRLRTPTFATQKRSQSVSSRTPSPTKPARRDVSSAQKDSRTSTNTPTSFIPQSRQLSGVGADQSGLGSPQVTALFEQRTPIVESASAFIPGKRAVVFEDPKDMADRVDQERRDEEAKENCRGILQREADGSQEDKDATFNLREMIDSLSPVRKPLKGRKSLHVGSARGILGKRPAESEDEDEAEENDGVKRLKGLQSSPVKNIRLQQPPSAEETTGRLTRSARLIEPIGKNVTPSQSSPLRNEPATTPRNHGRFRDAIDNKASHTVHEVNFYEPSPAQDAAHLAEDVDENEDRIHLQDFLNMTSIRFMELTTTKRRHTRAPNMFQDGTSAEGQDDMSLERCVVAGACTVPMLELYQHSCRELKNYISEGRRIVQEIEADTFDDNPALFREYIAAAPDVKALMDNQFKNVKTHARHQSKAMWYEWRMKLQDGLNEGLVRIAEGMEHDDKVLKEQQDVIGPVLPGLVHRYETLQEEHNNLEEAAQELADCDPTELEAAREELATLDIDIAEKRRLVAQLRQEFESSTTYVEELTAQKQQSLAEIAESEKVREECRGWTSTEINAMKARVYAIEKEYGWAVTGISGTTLSMSYKREIELVFDAASFQPQQPNSAIDLWYIAGDNDINAVPKTVEREFFLQCIRDHVRGLTQCQTCITDLLTVVRKAWDKANLASSQINRINVTFPTTVTKTSDSRIAVTSSLLLVPLETRVEITLSLTDRSGPEGVEVGVSAGAQVVYGEHFNVEKVGEFLLTRVGDKVSASEEKWSDVIVELHGRLIARGKK